MNINKYKNAIATSFCRWHETPTIDKHICAMNYYCDLLLQTNTEFIIKNQVNRFLYLYFKIKSLIPIDRKKSSWSNLFRWSICIILLKNVQKSLIFFFLVEPNTYFLDFEIFFLNARYEYMIKRLFMITINSCIFILRYPFKRST